MAESRALQTRKEPLTTVGPDAVRHESQTGCHASADALRNLQRTAGNRAVVDLLRAGQARLLVGPSDDPYEREADVVARQVVQSLHTGRAGLSGSPAVDEQRPVRRVVRGAPVGADGGHLDPATESAIDTARRGGGAPLAGTARQSMEQAFGGADFGRVRLHSGAGATALNRAVSAKAFTVGSDIFFSGPVPGGSPSEQHLLAHELTHTIQQGGATGPQAPRSAGRGGEAVARMLRLQRNGGLAVEFEADEAVDRGAQTVDALNGVLGSGGGMGAAQGGDYLSGGANDQSTEASMASSVFGIGTGVYGFGSGAKQTHEARKRWNAAKLTQMHKAAEGRNAARDAKTGVGNMLNSAGNVTSQSLSFVSSLSQNLGNSQVVNSLTAVNNNLLGGIGGAIALPFALLGTLRTMRKAAKQYDRFRKLRDKVENPETSSKDAEKALTNVKKSVVEAQKLVDEGRQDVAELKKRHAKVKHLDAETLATQADEVKAKEAVVDNSERLLAKAKDNEAQTTATRDKLAAVLKEKEKRAEDQKESAEDIQAYSFSKNKAGFYKKLVATVGGLLGIGGGIAATLASFVFVGAGVAGVSAAMATPVGWALAGAAALIGLGAGIYAFAKWANKRFEQLKKNNETHMKKGGEDTPVWKLRLRSLLPWVKVERESHRDHMAGRLFDLAVGIEGDDHADKAKKVLTSMGLDFKELKMHLQEDDHGTMVPNRKMREETVKLIAAKMAS